MYAQRPEYPSPRSRQLPSITSQQSIHIIDLVKQKSTTRDRRGISNLSPYISEIERRKKVRSVMRDKSERDRSTKKVQRETSANRFRIQECSYYTHHRNDSSLRRRRDAQISNDSTTNANITTTIGSTKTTIDKKRGFSRRKFMPQQLTLDPVALSPPTKDIHLRQLYDKLKSKCQTVGQEQQKGFRRGKYAAAQNDSQQQSNLRKIAYTVNNIEKLPSKQLQSDVRERNRTIVNLGVATNNDRRNFRRNKYQIQSQIITNEELKEDTKYTSVDIQKKQSNTSLIRELDMQTQKEAEQQDRLINLKIKKMLDKSLQKSTEQYFRQHHDNRHMKSRNQIQIYISTVKNPSINRCSQASTLNVSDRKEPLFVSTVKEVKQDDLLNYDFNLQSEVAGAKPIENKVCYDLPEEVEDSGSLDTVFHVSQFEKERREAEKRFAAVNDNVRVQWSDQDLDCTVKAELQY